MKIIHAANELKPGGRKVCLAIGVFDGVHLGHQQIIRQTVADARQHDAIALVITFDRHPSTVVAPDRVPPLIYSLPQKLGAIKLLGADTLLLIHFDRAFSGQTGEEFIRGLARDLGKIQSLCVGADFVFGHRRSGNVALLEKLGDELGFTVHGLAAVSLDNQIVSSTRIREAIRAGNLDAASQMLGRPYAISGRVIAGDGVGRKLGFPTANLDVAGLVLPPNGVYCRRRAQIRGTKRSARRLSYDYAPRRVEHRFPSNAGDRRAATSRRSAPGGFYRRPLWPGIGNRNRRKAARRAKIRFARKTESPDRAGRCRGEEKILIASEGRVTRVPNLPVRLIV